MESVTKDLSITAIIGMYVLLGLESILHFVFGKGLTGFYSGGSLGLNLAITQAYGWPVGRSRRPHPAMFRNACQRLPGSD